MAKKNKKTVNQNLKDEYKKKYASSKELSDASKSDMSRGSSMIPASALYDSIRRSEKRMSSKGESGKNVQPIRGIIDWTKGTSQGFDLFTSQSLPTIEPVLDFGNALRYNNSSGVLSFTNTDTIDGGLNKMSISFWAKDNNWKFRAGFGQTNSIDFKYDLADGPRVRLTIITPSTGSKRAIYNTNIDSLVKTGVNHIAIVYDGTQADIDKLKLYINNFEATVVDNNGVAASLPSTILQNPQFLCSSGVTIPELNEIVVDENIALTESQISSLYNQGKGADYEDAIRKPYIYAKLNQEDGATDIENIGRLEVNGTLSGFSTPPAYFVDYLPEIQPLADYKKIALAGQSNAISFATDAIPVDLEYNYFESIFVKDGLLFNMEYGLSGIGENGNQVFGYGVEYRITDNYLGSQNLGWVKYGESGSSVGSDGGGAWAFDGTNTLALISKAAAANYIPEWLVWIQGESDALRPTDSSAYQTNLEATFTAFRNAWGSGLKILIVGLYDFSGITSSTFYNNIVTAQQAIATAQLNTFYFDPVTDAGIVDPDDIKDSFHYNSTGIDKIAEECYNVILANS